MAQNVLSEQVVLFLREAFILNLWGLGHALIALVAAELLLPLIGVGRVFILGIIIAVGYEVLEYILLGREGIIREYNSLNMFLHNSVGDMIFTIAALAAAYGLWKYFQYSYKTKNIN